MWLIVVFLIGIPLIAVYFSMMVANYKKKNYDRILCRNPTPSKGDYFGFFVSCIIVWCIGSAFFMIVCEMVLLTNCIFIINVVSRTSYGRNTRNDIE